MSLRKAERSLRDDLHDIIETFQSLAMSTEHGLKFPERKLINGIANALLDQWVELEASRFNLATSEYTDAAEAVRTNIGIVETDLLKLESAISKVEEATALFSALDQLLQVALGFKPKSKVK